MSIAARMRGYGTTPRILGVDLARGLAVLGMFGAHIGVTEPFEWGVPATWLDLVHGRSSILFALLAGVSIAIISGRTIPLGGVELLQARTRIFTRAALIFAVGGVLQFLGTAVAVILPVYAVLFVATLPFLRWRPRRLFILASILAIVAPVIDWLVVTTSTFFALNGPGAPFIDLALTGTYPAVIWIVFALVGLGVGRLDLGRIRIAVLLVVAGAALAAVGYGGGAIGQLLVAPPVPAAIDEAPAPEPIATPSTLDGPDVDLTGSQCDDYGGGVLYCYPDGYFDQAPKATDVAPEPIPFMLDPTMLVSTAAHSGSIFEVVGSTGFALAVLGLSLIVARRLRWVLYPVIAVGSMALTAYSVHVVVLWLIGPGAFSQVDNGLYLQFIVGALVACTVWSVLFGRGPLERLLSGVSRRASGLVPVAGKLEPVPALSTVPAPPTRE